MIKEFAQYIENNTSFTIGTDFFTGYFPNDAQDTAVCVYDNGGVPDVQSGEKKAENRFQILSRSNSYFVARENCFTVFNFWLTKKGRIELPEVESGGQFVVLNCVPIDKPQYIGRDEKGRFEFSLNFIVYGNDA